MKSHSLTDAFTDALYGVYEQNLPEEIALQAKWCIIDFLGCAIYGSSLAHKYISGMTDSLNSDNGCVSVIGQDTKTSLHNAVFANAYAGHIAELDDGHRYAIVHPGTVIIPAVLGVAQSWKLETDQVLKGIVVGYEAAIRLGSALQPAHKRKGFHGTGTLGTIGAALGIAAAADLPKDCWKAVLSAACTDAGGILEIQENASELKPFNAARASAAGIDAYFIGASAPKVPEDILGGKRGFLEVYGDVGKEDFLLAGIEEKCAVETIYRKPYASCRYCHAPIDAVSGITETEEISWEDIESIEVETYDLAVRGHDHTRIDSVSSAKLSIPYNVAMFLIRRKADVSCFSEEYIKDKRLCDLMQRICVKENGQLSSMVPKVRGAIVTMKVNGNIYHNRVDYPKGEPENPMTEKDMQNKFDALLKCAGKNSDEAKKIYESVMMPRNRIQELFGSSGITVGDFHPHAQ